jgi:hypothetical protein
MPISLYPKQGSNLLEVVVSGKLAHEDYVRFAPEVDRMVAKHGKVRILMDMVDFHGWEPSALWDETKFTFKHYSHISRIAMVGDKKWEHLMSLVCHPFTRAEVRYFEWAHLLDARKWVEEPRKETFSRMIAGAAMK